MSLKDSLEKTVDGVAATEARVKSVAKTTTSSTAASPPVSKAPQFMGQLSKTADPDKTSHLFSSKNRLFGQGGKDDIFGRS